jgi:hypothetical protein
LVTERWSLNDAIERLERRLLDVALPTGLRAGPVGDAPLPAHRR